MLGENSCIVGRILMLACPVCGTPTPSTASACPRCGTGLLPRAEAPSAPAPHNRTVLGLAPSPSPGPAKRSTAGRTVALSPSPVADRAPTSAAPAPQQGAQPYPDAAPAVPQQPPQGAAPASLHKTMLGMPQAAPPIGATGPAPATPMGATSLGVGIAPVGPPAQVSDAPAPQRVLHATSLGVGVAPVDPALPQPANVPASGGAGVRHRGADLHKQTLLGVAMPGIAPLRAGEKGASPPNSPPAPTALPPTAEGTPADSPSGGPPPLSDHELRLAGVPRRSAHGRLAWFLGLGAIVLGAIAFIAYRNWQSWDAISIRVSADEAGVETLEVTCATCPDGTTVTLQSEQATVQTQKALLKVGRPLALGSNRLEIGLRKPASSKTETITVSVPVTFRIRADLSKIRSDAPRAVVVVDAVRDAVVEVDGAAVGLDASGHAEVPVDVSGALTGPSSSVVPLERQVAYVVTQAGQAYRGQVSLRMGITPLELITPRTRLITQNGTFGLAGRTARGATLTANGHSITVGPDGLFSQDMALSSAGTTKLRLHASLEGQAPRLVMIDLERVTDLRARAMELTSTAERDYDRALARGEDPKTPVALSGELVEMTEDGKLSRMVLNVPCSHSPCLARVEFGGNLPARRGSQVSFLGSVTPEPATVTTTRALYVSAWLVLDGKLQ